jgi:hypothetical protein
MVNGAVTVALDPWGGAVNVPDSLIKAPGPSKPPTVYVVPCSLTVPGRSRPLQAADSDTDVPGAHSSPPRQPSAGYAPSRSVPSSSNPFVPLRDAVPDCKLSTTRRPPTIVMSFDVADCGSTAVGCSVVALALWPALGLGEVTAFPPQPTAPARLMMTTTLDAFM